MGNMYNMQSDLTAKNTLRRSVNVVLRLCLGMALVYSLLTSTCSRMDPQLYSLHLPS